MSTACGFYSIRGSRGPPVSSRCSTSHDWPTNPLDRPEALLATSVGITMPEPPDELMVQPWIYRWRMRLEHATSLHLLGRGAKATRFIDELIADPELPSPLMVDSLALRQSAVDAAAHMAGTRAHAEDVSAAHLGAAPMLTELVGNVATVEVGLPIADPWRLTSASVAGNDNGFALHLTAADSRAVGAADAVARHFLQTHDDTGAPLLVREILVGARHSAGVSPGGFHEAKLFWWEDGWRCLGSGHGTAADASGESLLIGLGSDGASSASLAAVPSASDGSRRDMMPVVVNGRLFVVTGLDPFELVAWDRRSRAVRSGDACGQRARTGGLDRWFIRIASCRRLLVRHPPGLPR